MTGPVDDGRLSRWASAVHAVDSATSVVRAEAAALAGGIELTVAAVDAINVQAKRMYNESARIAAAGFDALPPGYYLAASVRGLRGQLNATRLVGSSTRHVLDRIDEMQGMFQVVVDLTASVDVAGQLGLPLELVSTAQTGARSALSSLDRMSRAVVDLANHASVADHQVAVAARPRPAAQWLLTTAGRVLPRESRERYVEEFRSELYTLAEDGAGLRRQLDYAARQIANLWSLRRALPRTPDVDPVERTRTSSGIGGRRGPMIWTYLNDSIQNHLIDQLYVRNAPARRNARQRAVYRRGSRSAAGLVQTVRPGQVPVGDLPTLRAPAKHRRGK